MNNSLEQLLDRFERSASEREVEEELQFHIEMQARDFERQGLTPEEALARAALRFGDFAQIKMQCIRISKRNDARTLAMRILFTVAFLLGVFIRILSSEFHVTQVGDLLIMISVFGACSSTQREEGQLFSRPGENRFS